MAGLFLDRDYYAAHDTLGDRIALWYYARAIRAAHPGGGRLLDFGCGTGHLLRRLALHFEATGYDSSPYARAQCRLHAPHALILEEWDSIAPHSLDVVVALHTLEHLERPRDEIGALAKRLVPGGLFFAVVPNPGGLGRRLKGSNWFAYRDSTHCSILSQTQWLQILADAGLRVSSVRGDGMWDPPYVPLLPSAVQRLLFGAPAAVQVFSPVARPFLPPMLGECLILQARRA